MHGLATSTGRFLWLAIRPGGRAASIVIDIVGVSGIGLVAWAGNNTAASLAAVFGFGFFLFAIAGVRLQRTKDKRDAWGVTCRPIVEHHPHHTAFLIKVVNTGRTTTLSASIPSVTGPLGDGYSVDLPVWRDTDRTITDASKGQARILRLADFNYQQPRLQFWTSDNPAGAGLGLPMEPEENEGMEVGFTLVFVNSGPGGDDATDEWDGHISIPPGAEEIKFRLVRGT